MFTGLIRELATVVNFANNILTLKARYRPKVGDSIAINGACLTVISANDETFSVELSPESQKILALDNYKNNVHIEPAMLASDRFEGHIVQGHIDCIGEVVKITSRENGTDFIIKVEPKYISYIIPKGSITIDGVSLTINDVYSDSFRLTIIPHTLRETLIGKYKIKTKINIETDLFARYIDHILQHRSQKRGMSWDEVDRIQMSY